MSLKAVFYAEPRHRFDAALSQYVGPGIRERGDTYAICNIQKYNGVPDGDVAVFVGVKGRSRFVFDTYREAGKHTVVFDKGYNRTKQGVDIGTLFWRVSVDDLQPHRYLMSQKYRDDRWEALGQKIKPMRRDGSGIFFCGGSQKYCNWHCLGDATAYAKTVLDTAAKFTKQKLIYRPKPSWRDAVPIKGYGYSGEDKAFKKEVANCYQTITYGSNACFESLLLGIPTIVLGDGIARSLARTRIEDVVKPLYPTEDEVYRLACAVSYCQWTREELSSGKAWKHLRKVIASLS